MLNDVIKLCVTDVFDFVAVTRRLPVKTKNPQIEMKASTVILAKALTDDDMDCIASSPLSYSTSMIFILLISIFLILSIAFFLSYTLTVRLAYCEEILRGTRTIHGI